MCVVGGEWREGGREGEGRGTEGEGGKEGRKEWREKGGREGGGLATHFYDDINVYALCLGGGIL